MDQIQSNFLLHLMKGIVADLVVGSHRENSLPSCLKSFTLDFGVGGARAIDSELAWGRTSRLFIFRTDEEETSGALNSVSVSGIRTKHVANYPVVSEIARASPKTHGSCSANPPHFG